MKQPLGRTGGRGKGGWKGGDVGYAPIAAIANTTYAMDPYILKMVARLSH